MLVATVCAVLLPGCGLWRPARVPMPTIAVASACAARPDTLVIFLPGAYSLPQEYLREGFVEALRRRSIAADVVIADAHLGYYRNRSVIDRFEADVLAPARAQGYAHIWLVGISLGGFGAFINAQAHPQGIDGIVALAPYLGEAPTVESVRAQGGLARWRAPQAPSEATADDTMLWRWLQGYADPATAATRPALYLGWGRDDRFKDVEPLLAAALPPQRVFNVPGGHDWPPWRALWEQVLDTAPLPRCAG
jgi:pimeloyl-ACP methyl ester carboxylesterase